ncbi:hypothetical protein IWZ00DRAFT_281169 [Phyllosticta capitalensis]
MHKFLSQKIAPLLQKQQAFQTGQLVRNLCARSHLLNPDHDDDTTTSPTNSQTTYRSQVQSLQQPSMDEVTSETVLYPPPEALFCLTEIRPSSLCAGHQSPATPTGRTSSRAPCPTPRSNDFSKRFFVFSFMVPERCEMRKWLSTKSGVGEDVNLKSVHKSRFLLLLFIYPSKKSSPFSSVVERDTSNVEAIGSTPIGGSKVR